MLAMNLSYRARGAGGELVICRRFSIFEKLWFHLWMFRIIINFHAAITLCVKLVLLLEFFNPRNRRTVSQSTVLLLLPLLLRGLLETWHYYSCNWREQFLRQVLSVKSEHAAKEHGVSVKSNNVIDECYKHPSSELPSQWHVQRAARLRGSVPKVAQVSSVISFA